MIWGGFFSKRDVSVDQGGSVAGESGCKGNLLTGLSQK